MGERVADSGIPDHHQGSKPGAKTTDRRDGTGLINLDLQTQYPANLSQVRDVQASQKDIRIPSKAPYLLRLLL